MTTTKKKAMFTTILIVLAVLFAGLLIIGALRPADYRVSRSTSMAAPASAIFAHVNAPKNWEAWNPWGKIDPNMKLTYDGPAAGVGASYAWAGNNQVGEGKMTVTESKPDERIQFRLDFHKPMAGTSDAEFTFKPEGDKTLVTWTMSGKNNFIARIMCLFMNMDKMIGGQFDKGLADMKTVLERPSSGRING
jgi:uncharacterized protein YndB with AHSA1/START domain